MMKRLTPPSQKLALAVIRRPEQFPIPYFNEQKLDADRTKMETYSSAVLAARTKVVADSSAISAAEHQIEVLQTQIEDSELTAPARGRVQYRLAEPGEVLPAGGKVATIINLRS